MSARRHRYWRLAQAVRHQRRAAGLAATYTTVIIGTMLIALSLVSMAVLIHDVYVGDERSLASSPVIGEEESSSTFALSYASIDDKPVTLVVIDGEEGSTPLPPGISRLPEPGEAFVSPRLREELTGSRAELFGKVVGTIDRTALESPNERRVYLRPGPQASLTSDSYPLAHFGVPSGSTAVARGTGYLYRASLRDATLMLAFAILVPGLMTVGIGVASGSEHTRRSFRMLAGIGFSRRHFLIVDLLEHLPFVAIGALLVLLGLLPFLHWDLVIPFLDARYTADDIRAIAPMLLVLILTGACLALMTVVVVRALVRTRVMRTRGTPARRLALQGVLASVVILLLVLAVVLPRLLPGHPLVGPLLILTGLAESALMWAPVSVLCSGLAAVLLTVVARRTAPSLLVTTRLLRLAAARHFAVIVGVSAVILVAGLLQLKASTMTGQMAQAQENIDRYGSRVLSLNGISAATVPDELVAALPAGTEVLASGIIMSEDSVTTTLIGGCTALEAAGFTCPGDGRESEQAPVSHYAAFVAGDGRPVTVRQADPRTSEMATPLLVSVAGTPLDIDTIQTLASTYAPGAAVSVRSDWMVSAAQVMREAYWCMVASAIGGVGVLYALGVSITASVRRDSRLMAPVGAVTGVPSLAGTATAATVGIPILLSGLLSTIVYNVLPLGMTAVINDPYLPNWKASPALTVGALVLTTLTALATAVRAYRIARRDTLEWRPGR